jgi:hypothetical protein
VQPLATAPSAKIITLMGRGEGVKQHDESSCDGVLTGMQVWYFEVIAMTLVRRLKQCQWDGVHPTTDRDHGGFKRWEELVVICGNGSVADDFGLVRSSLNMGLVWLVRKEILKVTFLMISFIFH